MEDADRALALALQEEYNREVASSDEDLEQYVVPNGGSNAPLQSDIMKPRSIVDPALELLDPSPDIRVLFQEFNAMYFWGKLSMVEVRWSPRMTLSAGLCCYEGRGGLCSIRLSKPLLQLRPRKDLVETLLHEMIHALLFVTDNNKDHDGHGPEFCKHMYRINKETGTNITIYHNFHDEVDQLRQHWWRCEGSCRTKPPYFGYVRRAMNRAPSPKDPWWRRHQATCGGSYVKVKEPENYGKKKVKEKTAKEKGPDITTFLTQSGKNTGVKNTSASVNGTTTTSSNQKDSSSGHRLGGNNIAKSNGRGIPAFSRLLNPNNNLSNTPSTASTTSVSGSSTSSSRRSSLIDTLNDEWKELYSNKRKDSEHPNNGLLNPNNNLSNTPSTASTTSVSESSTSSSRRLSLIDKLNDEWKELYTKKRKNGEHPNITPQKRKKRTLTIPELIARMQRKGQKSVNAGAPAFKSTPPITSFNNRIIRFQDSQEETQNSSSDKENQNQKIFPTKQQKETKTSGTHNISKQDKPFFKSNSSILPSLDSDDEDCTLSDIFNKRVADSGSKFCEEQKILSTVTSQSCVVSDDEDLPENEFSRSEIIKQSTQIGTGSSFASKDNFSSGNSRNFSKRLPSMSDSDENETLSQIFDMDTKITKPSNKKTRTDSFQSDAMDGPGENSGSYAIEKAPCPICCVEIPLSVINSHIDDCLSLKAIRDSAFD